MYRHPGRLAGACRASRTAQGPSRAAPAPFELAAASARSLRTLVFNERCIGRSSSDSRSARSCAMNGTQTRFVALLAAATLATRALGETGDHVAACYSPSTTVTLTNRENIVLNQNSPNPFAEQTTITYKLPNTVKTAKMVFYDAHGELIKVVDISSSRSRSDDGHDGIGECAGEGRVFVFGDDLSDGLYTYALVIDKKTVDSKQMIKSRSRSR